MTDARVIRYRAKPEAADENERLIRAVFAQLAEEKPDGVHYTVLRDGDRFSHTVVVDAAENPLLTMSAFQAFQAEIGDRCAEGPDASQATVVGSY